MRQNQLLGREENVGVYDLTKEKQTLCPDRRSLEVLHGVNMEDNINSNSISNAIQLIWKVYRFVRVPWDYRIQVRAV